MRQSVSGEEEPLSNFLGNALDSVRRGAIDAARRALPQRCELCAGASGSELLCRGCARECESPRHHCGADAERRRGIVGFGNDLVNFTATLAGAIAGAALYLLQ